MLLFPRVTDIFGQIHHHIINIEHWTMCVIGYLARPIDLYNQYQSNSPTGVATAACVRWTPCNSAWLSVRRYRCFRYSPYTLAGFRLTNHRLRVMRRDVEQRNSTLAGWFFFFGAHCTRRLRDKRQNCWTASTIADGIAPSLSEVIIPNTAAIAQNPNALGSAKRSQTTAADSVQNTP